MQPTNQHQRINLAKLKAQIVKKLGPEGSKQYFYCLNRFLSLKLSRVEFNKLCIRICVWFVKRIHFAIVTRKARTGTRDRKASDCPSAQEPNGKANFVSRQLLTEQDSKFNVSLENGDLTQHDIERLVHHHQGVTEQANNEGEVLHHLSSNFLTIKRLPDDSTSIHSKDQIETVDFENRKEVPYRSELCAPLGVPSCPVSVGGARKTIPVASSSNCSSSFTSGCLLDTATLRERMEQIAAAQGLEEVPMDSANLLNNGLDAYLRGLILACIELVRARLGNEPTKSSTHKHQAHSKLINDFRVAMELNPQQLGEDWPLLLEKICTQSFEE
ncbi:hypothetical protein Acr_26g0005460 [Actinidia rufa]|uniref:Uncharacterized protein n=1 Tax=Actinidia rufa TaxID=165716 RepID=A0A7J0H2G7_9ERIC|nr:hypothetical protein Acr_26g0005460 [Actinidia rufa]